MHVGKLIELAGILASHGYALLCSDERLSADTIEQYWTTSKVRLDRWAFNLKNIKNLPKSATAQESQPSPTMVRNILEEILASEILTRVWTALLCAYDRRHGTDEMEPVARSVMIGHMEARHRVLTLLVRESGIDSETAVALNRLRRSAERWTDLLVGSLSRICDVSEFAVEPERAQDFANDLRERGEAVGGRHAWPVVMASLQATFTHQLNPISPNADLNSRIASSILSCFPPDTFDSTGQFHSLWYFRLSKTADETQGMIANLLSKESTDHVQNGGPQCPHSSLLGRETRIRRFGG